MVWPPKSDKYLDFLRCQTTFFIWFCFGNIFGLILIDLTWSRDNNQCPRLGLTRSVVLDGSWGSKTRFSTICCCFFVDFPDFPEFHKDWSDPHGRMGLVPMCPRLYGPNGPRVPEGTDGRELVHPGILESWNPGSLGTLESRFPDFRILSNLAYFNVSRMILGQ